MKLASVLSPHFDSAVRSRGVSYFRSGAVRVQRASDSEVEARVRGSQVYEVEISWDGELLTLYCDCPYYDSAGPCKHLWATILAADARDCLRAITKLSPDSIFFDSPGDEFGDEDLDDEWEDDFDFYQPARRRTAPSSSSSRYQPQVVPPAWKQQLQQVATVGSSSTGSWPATRELLYVITAGSGASGPLTIDLVTREPKKKGGWKKPGVPRLTRAALSRLPDPRDRHILGLLSGISDANEFLYLNSYETLPTGFRVRGPFALITIPAIAATGRCMLRLSSADTELLPLVWDEGEPWRFEARLSREGAKKCVIGGCLSRGEEVMDLSAPALVSSDFVVTRDRIMRLAGGTPWEWISSLRRLKTIEGPAGEIEQILAALIEHPLTVPVRVPEDLKYQEVRPVPRPCLTIRSVKQPYASAPDYLRAELSFDYDGRRVPAWPEARGVYDASTRIFLVRDREAEHSAKEFARQNGFVEQTGPEWSADPNGMTVLPKKLPEAARACLDAGWHVEAEGKIFRRPGAMRVEVSSGVDWFELHGEIAYGETTAKLPALLAALRRGEKMVRLDDGTYGLLPEEWLSRFGQIAGLGTAATDHVRFRRNQAGLLDALLATQPEVSCDERFARTREELRHFEGIRAAEQPSGFRGQLRDYQREGIGWMDFLRRFGFGGCLADDMGVGKTAQVLALLEHRRSARAANGHGGDGAPCGPSLVVLPKSLVFNWKQEAARFTPELRVLDHTGLARNVNAFRDYDVILTTYGTLRRDAAEFKDLEFDYIVLDEAQAIKNADTESAKAARLLRGRNRLALSGTPVENHLGELWSIFEFLNPGMLGAASVFKMSGGAARNPSEETRRLLAHALRPFILRRTKEQVARELPSKSEQTIFCELDGPQRKLYNELRTHYRNSLLNHVAARGLAKSKIQVLEALLRLRQAACHPGLLDPKRRSDSSAKLEVLTSRLIEVVEEGHKALVFSQFTSLLSIVQERLDEAGIVYEYLDGATRDRQQRVERFQNDPDCGLFLISLKAGGLGLNLTAAEYVFLLDPWWNPAVEAQAVDRAHRIGQTRQVFAYRLIARDTVEEKVLQLQNSKRDLANAIISQDNSVIRNLQAEDLELLLS